MKKMTKEEYSQALQSLQDWKIVSDREAICKNFRFSTFAEAFGWMAQIALVAEKMDHHPEWLNVYNQVTVTLSTHDAKGITQKDILLAKAMDKAGMVLNVNGSSP